MLYFKTFESVEKALSNIPDQCYHEHGTIDVSSGEAPGFRIFNAQGQLVDIYVVSDSEYENAPLIERGE